MKFFINKSTNRYFVSLICYKLSISNKVNRIICACIFQAFLFKIQHTQGNVHAISERSGSFGLTQGMRNSKIQGIKNVSGSCLTYNINCIIELVISYDRHKCPGNAMTSAIYRGKNSFSFSLCNPVKVATNYIFGKIKNKGIRESFFNIIVRRKNGILDPSGIIDGIHY